MLKTMVITSVITGALVLSSSLTFAAEQDKIQQQEQALEQVHGSELMTDQERDEHRSKMRAAETNEERERIRTEQHERMKERAKEVGKTLPDKPPVRGRGKGPRAPKGAGRNR